MSEVAYRVVFARRRSVRLSVAADGQIEVRAPRGTSRRWIDRFVAQHQAWLAEQQQQRQQQLQRYADGATVPWLGQQHPLTLQSAPRTRLDRHPDGWCLLGPGIDDPTWVRDTLARYCRQWALPLLEQRLERLWPRLQVLGVSQRPTLRVRRMRRRWGSCSRSGEILINWLLLRQPLEQVDMVLAHELCHLLEFNHSPRFYRLLDQLLPGWRQAEQRLQQDRHALAW